MKHPPTIDPPSLPAAINDPETTSVPAKAAVKRPRLRLVFSRKSAANRGRRGLPTDQREQLHMLVATIDRELTRLSSTATLLAEEGNVDELIMSWEALMRLLIKAPSAPTREAVVANDANQTIEEPVR